MLTTDPLLISALKQSGYSLTSARAQVFEALEKSEAVSMAELVRALDSHIDRATVYRTIELFEKLGIVTRLSLGWKYKIELSENFSHHHHHLSCPRCGTVVSFEEGELLQRAIEHIATAKGYRIQDHSLEIRGVCPNCQKSLSH